MNTRLSGHTEATSHPPAPSAYFLPQKLRREPANERLRLPELQVEEQEAREFKVGSRSPYQVGGIRLQLQGATGRLGKSGGKQGLKDGWEEDADGMLFQKRPPIRTRGRAH